MFPDINQNYSPVFPLFYLINHQGIRYYWDNIIHSRMNQLSYSRLKPHLYHRLRVSASSVPPIHQHSLRSLRTCSSSSTAWNRKAQDKHMRGSQNMLEWLGSIQYTENPTHKESLTLASSESAYVQSFGPSSTGDNRKGSTF